MIKFRASGGGVTLYGFGISRANVDQLIAGHPIAVDLRDMGGPPIRIGIMFGETEEDVFKELKNTGAIDPDCIFHPAEPGETHITRHLREDPNERG